MGIRALFLCIVFMVGCASNPYDYADEPDDYGYATLGMCAVGSATAVSAAHALEAADEDKAAMAIISAHEVAVPACQTLAAALSEYWRLRALGEDTTEAAAMVAAANARATAAVAKLDDSMGGK